MISSLLFVGPLWDGSTCLSRFNAIKCLDNLEVCDFDDSLWLPPRRRFLRSFVQRTFCYPSVLKMNWRLISFAFKKKYDLIWIEKGEWIYPFTLFMIKKTGARLIHYNTDDVFGQKNHLWLHRLGIKFYDLYLTTNRDNVVEVANKYKVRTMRVGMGFDDRFSASKFPANKLFDIVFVGHWEPHTELHIMALKEAGLNVRVWGHNWRKANESSLKSAVPLPQSLYSETITQAKIALCFLSKWNRNESTGRSFEIPALGTLLLGEYTDEHNYIYDNGVGAAFFHDQNSDELISLARHYLVNDEILESVSKEGYCRSISPGYSWALHLQREWPLILDRLGIKLASPSIDIDAPFWKGFRDGARAPSARMKKIF